MTDDDALYIYKFLTIIFTIILAGYIEIKLALFAIPRKTIIPGYIQYIIQLIISMVLVWHDHFFLGLVVYAFFAILTITTLPNDNQ